MGIVWAKSKERVMPSIDSPVNIDSNEQMSDRCVDVLAWSEHMENILAINLSVMWDNEAPVDWQDLVSCNCSRK